MYLVLRMRKVNQTSTCTFYHVIAQLLVNYSTCFSLCQIQNLAMYHTSDDDQNQYSILRNIFAAIVDLVHDVEAIFHFPYNVLTASANLF